MGRKGAAQAGKKNPEISILSEEASEILSGFARDKDGSIWNVRELAEATLRGRLCVQYGELVSFSSECLFGLYRAQRVSAGGAT